jgi:hypothetical protein
MARLMVSSPASPPQDHVRFLAQSGAERRGEAVGMLTDLPLVQERLFALVMNSSGLQGQDVLLPGELMRSIMAAGWWIFRTGRSVTRTRPFFNRVILRNPSEAQVVGCQYLAGDNAEHRSDSLVLQEQLPGSGRIRA